MSVHIKTLREYINLFESNHTVPHADHIVLSKLKDGESHSFEDINGIEFTAKREGNNIHFYQTKNPKKSNLVSLANHRKVMALADGELYSFKDEAGHDYTMKRIGDKLKIIRN